MSVIANLAAQTFYFDSAVIEPATNGWQNAGNIVDSSPDFWSNYSAAGTSGLAQEYQTLDSTDYDGVTNYGGIETVEFRIFGAYGQTDSLIPGDTPPEINVNPYFGGATLGNFYAALLTTAGNHSTTVPPYYTAFSPWMDITSDPTGPGAGSWSWNDINTLDLRLNNIAVERDKSPWGWSPVSGRIHGVELRVSTLKPELDLKLTIPPFFAYTPAVKANVQALVLYVPRIAIPIMPETALGLVLSVPTPSVRLITSPDTLQLELSLPVSVQKFIRIVKPAAQALVIEMPDPTIRQIWHHGVPLGLRLDVIHPKIGPAIHPTTYRVEMRDRSFDLIRVLTKQAVKLNWEYKRIGGCGAADIELSTLYDTYEDILQPDYDVQIYLERENFPGAILVYKGYIDSYKPTQSDNDKVVLKINGYASQLARVIVEKTYTNMEITDIIKDIMDTYVVPNTSIFYKEPDIDIEPTSFVCDSIAFDTTADRAIKTLAALAGGVEWGVGRDRKFFFKKQVDTIRHRVRQGKELKEYSIDYDYGSIINKLFIRGGTTNDEQFTDEAANSESQSLYGIRSEVISNSSIVTTAVSQRYATSILAEKARINRRVKIKIIDNKKFFEEIIPMGRINILRRSIKQPSKYGSGIKYGDKSNKIKYGGEQSLQIDKIRYTIESEGTSVSIQAGLPLPDLAQEIKKLEFEIAQVRNV